MCMLYDIVKDKDKSYLMMEMGSMRFERMTSAV